MNGYLFKEFNHTGMRYSNFSKLFHGFSPEESGDDGKQEAWREETGGVEDWSLEVT